MTNKTEMVSVPRELLEVSVSIPRSNAEFQSQVAVIEKIRALLAAPAEDVRAVGEEPEISTSDLVIQALELGMMIHGSGKAAKDDRYELPVFSVMISATTKKEIIVYAADVHSDHEQCLRNACNKAIARAKSNVKSLKRFI